MQRNISATKHVEVYTYGKAPQTRIRVLSTIIAAQLAAVKGSIGSPVVALRTY